MYGVVLDAVPSSTRSSSKTGPMLCPGLIAAGAVLDTAAPDLFAW
jgi:hypothetical protein